MPTGSCRAPSSRSSLGGRYRLELGLAGRPVKSITLKQTGRGKRRTQWSSRTPSSLFTWCGAALCFVIPPRTKPWPGSLRLMETSMPSSPAAPPRRRPRRPGRTEMPALDAETEKEAPAPSPSAVPGPSSAVEATLIPGEGSRVRRGHPGGLPAHASCVI